MQLNQAGIQILHVLIHAAAVLTEGHDVANIVVRGNNRNLNIWFIGLCDHGRIRIVMGVIHHDGCAVGFFDTVDDRGQSRDQLEVELALEPLLNDLHMEHAQKAAAKTKAQRHGALGLVGEGSIVQLELFQGVPEIGVF